MIQLALYKGPPSGVTHWAAHIAVCVGTISKYSHVELVIDGVCYSSSVRDGGVRSKRIDLDCKWDVIEIKCDAQRAINWFRAHEGEGYDWPGIARFALPVIHHRRKKWFCSEAVAAMIGLESPHKWSPGALARYYGKGGLP